jgi:cytochrome c oxidase subunit II
MPPAVRRPALLALIALAALAVAGAALAGNGGFAPVEPASPSAERTDDVYWVLLGVAAFILLVVFGPLVAFIIRFGHRGRPRSVEGPQIRGNTQLELGWTIGATLIVIGLVVVVLYKLPGIDDPAAADAGQPLEVTVEGRQFYWLYEYEDGVSTVDTLTLPVDRPVTLKLTAPDGDVIHSWWVPALAGKRDAIPGIVNELELYPTKTGTYEGVCAELCGVQHAVMRTTVRVVEQAEFEEFLASQREESDLGGQIWAGVCQKCHDPEIAIGPEIVGNPLLADRDELRKLVTEGREKMPAVGQDWSDEQMNALLDFAEKLGGGGGG